MHKLLSLLLSALLLLNQAFPVYAQHKLGKAARRGMVAPTGRAFSRGAILPNPSDLMYAQPLLNASTERTFQNIHRQLPKQVAQGHAPQQPFPRVEVSPVLINQLQVPIEVSSKVARRDFAAIQEQFATVSLQGGFSPVLTTQEQQLLFLVAQLQNLDVSLNFTDFDRFRAEAKTSNFFVTAPTKYALANIFRVIEKNDKLRFPAVFRLLRQLKIAEIVLKNQQLAKSRGREMSVFYRMEYPIELDKKTLPDVNLFYWNLEVLGLSYANYPQAFQMLDEVLSAGKKKNKKLPTYHVFAKQSAVIEALMPVTEIAKGGLVQKLEIVIGKSDKQHALKEVQPLAISDPERVLISRITLGDGMKFQEMSNKFKTTVKALLPDGYTVSVGKHELGLSNGNKNDFRKGVVHMHFLRPAQEDSNIHLRLTVQVDASRFVHKLDDVTIAKRYYTLFEKFLNEEGRSALQEIDPSL